MDVSLDPRKRDLDKRLESIGWGLVFLLFGALAMPAGTAEYAAVAAIGGALIGLNVVRVALGIAIAWFGLILGASLLIAGIGALSGVHMDAFVLFFAIAGAVTIVAALVRPRSRADSKATGEA